jgi:hypothetical protein
MKRLHTQSILLLITAILMLGLSAAAWAKGKPTKVEVLNADPSVAAQGEVVDVIVSGSGFDAGSDVSYLVSGTTDNSQVVVESVEYISSSQLKTRIRPKENALVTDYDIEVRASSGRKGKGTTLFRVSAKESGCTGFESKEPEIAYLKEFDTSGDIHTQDLYLSSGSGCDQYLMAENVVMALPIENGPNDMQGEFLSQVGGLRLDTESGLGVVAWVDTAQDPSPVKGLMFTYDDYGNVSIDPAGIFDLYVSADGADVKSVDVRFKHNQLGELEFVIVEKLPGALEKRVILYQPDVPPEVPALLVLGSGCLAVDAAQVCYDNTWVPWWNSDGSQIFLNGYSTLANKDALMRFRKVNGNWLAGEILMTSEDAISFQAVSANDSLLYRFTETDRRKNGKIAQRTSYTAMIHSGLCSPFECVPRDGTILPIDLSRLSGGWTKSGGLLFLDVQAVDKAHIREYINPYTAEVGTLQILEVDYSQRNTAF